MSKKRFFKKAFKILLMAKLLKAEPEELMYQLTELLERYHEKTIQT